MSNVVHLEEGKIHTSDIHTHAHESHTHPHAHQEHANSSHAGSNYKLRNYLFYGVLVIVILLLGLWLRTTLLHYWGFYEPDDFFHYAVIRAAVNNNFIIPKYLSISGWPVHAMIQEPRGLYWVTLGPYFILRFFGFSYYTIERWMAVVFGFLDILGAYLLARFVSKDKFFLLLVMALVALSAGDAARTSALIYRGDSFVTFFLIAALVLFIYVFKSRSRNEKILYAVLSGIALSATNFVWNGAPFVTLIYLLSLILIEFVAFVRNNEEILKDCMYIMLALFVWTLCVDLLISVGQINPGSQILTGLQFIPVLVLLVVSWLLARYILAKKYINKPSSRLVMVVLFLIVGMSGLYLVDPNLVTGILINNGVTVTNAFSATIQELTPPTYSFLFASFGYALYTSPVAILMTLPSVVLHNIPATSLLRVELDLIFWIVMLFGFIPYLFMKVYDSGKFLGGNSRLRFGIEVETIVLIVYFATTAFLQIYAIRFNSLVAVPLAVLGAYTIYWLILASRGLKLTLKIGPIVVLAVSFVLFWSMLSDVTSNVLAVVIGMVLAILVSGSSFVLMKNTGKYEITGYVVTLVLLITIIYFDGIFSSNISPADSMNSQLFSAMGWLKNNSANSSVVLTLWPDGSVVEGVANRTSITDSVGSQNAQLSDAFANWILNSSNDPQFLTGNLSDYPNYLVVRYVWLYGESQGIFEESGLNTSLESGYAFAPLNQFNEYINATSKIFKFQSNQGIDALVEISNNTGITAYAQTGTGISPFSYVAFQDITSGNYSVVKQTAYNQTNNQMILIQYSDVRNPSLAINITNAVILTPYIAESNMAKFLYFCGPTECIWDNNVATANLVFSNQDTRIFKLTYNKTS